MYSNDCSTWTQLGSNLTLTLANTWYHFTVDLNSLEGANYYLGFRTNTGTAGVRYYIDLIFGPDLPPDLPGEPALISPDDGAINIEVTPTFSWAAPTTGGIPEGYYIYCDNDNPPTTIIGNVDNLSFTPTIPFEYNRTYYWTVAAYNYTGEGPQAPVRSFSTKVPITNFPYTDGDFENEGNLPINWTVTE